MAVWNSAHPPAHHKQHYTLNYSQTRSEFAVRIKVSYRHTDV